MPATLEAKRQRPLRGKCVRVAPQPEPCLACGGDGYEPHDESVRCLTCDGSGTQRAWFRLPPARTDRYRRVIYRPSCTAALGRLQIATARDEGKKLDVGCYSLAEFAADGKGRAFAVHKDGEKQAYHLFLGRDEVRCDCAGFTYLATPRANQEAHERGDETFGGLGCCHSDSCAALLSGGWFDLPGDL